MFIGTRKRLKRRASELALGLSLFWLGGGDGAGPIVPVLWTPAASASTTWWLKANEVTDADGTAQVALVDASGFARNATQANGANRAVVRSAILNGLNVLEFDGVNDNYALPSAVISGATGGAVFAVVRRLGGLTAFLGPVVGHWGTSGFDDLYPFSGGGVYSGFLQTTRPNCGNPGGDDNNLLAWHLMEFRSGPSNFQYNHNATNVYSNSTNTVSAGASPLIGTNTTHFFRGYIAEIVYIDEDPSEELAAKIQGYLAHKWGLTAILPIAHPYKTDAPTLTGDLISDLPLDTAPLFGALTKAGAGGSSVGDATTITAGNASGHWTITNGYLVPTTTGDTANLNAGPYTLTLNTGQVVNVTIEANTWDVRRSSELASVLGESAATLAGKKIAFRPGVYSTGVNGTSTKLKNANFAGLTLESRDFLNRARMARFDKFNLAGAQGITFRGLYREGSEIPAFTFTGSAGNIAQNNTIAWCVLLGVERDINGDFSGTPGVETGEESFGNADMIVYDTNQLPYLGSLTVQNNEIGWFKRAVTAGGAQGEVIVKGNKMYGFYGLCLLVVKRDDFNYHATFTDNFCFWPMARSDDEGLPHPDWIKGNVAGSNATDWEWLVERNVHITAGARGTPIGVMMIDIPAGTFYTGRVVGNVFIGQSTIAYSINRAKNLVFSNNTGVSDSTSPSTTLQTGVGVVETAGTVVIERNIVESLANDPSATLADNKITGPGGSSIPFASLFDGNGGNWAPMTLAETLNTFARKTGGPADLGGPFDAGAIASGAVTWATTNPGDDGVTHVP